MSFVVEFQVRPIDAWPGKLTVSRQRSRFNTGWGQTCHELDRELRHLGASGVALLMALDAGDIRLDGRPRANARPAHPGVILVCQTRKVGSLRMACDKFVAWQDNVLAIARSLEALRMVDRYGCTRTGEQYRGWQALPPPEVKPAASPRDQAKEILRRFIGGRVDMLDPAAAVREAQVLTHPDRGGEADDFKLVMQAKELLECNAMESPSVKAIAPWYGGNRILAHEVGRELRGCEWVGVPFMGGGAELFTIEARTVLANDLHAEVINLAQVMADDQLGPKLYRRLRRLAFHPSLLEIAQRAIATYRAPYDSEEAKLNFAELYFVAVWMGRSANAGTARELSGGLPIRWNAGGGDSAKRYQSAASSIPAFRRWLRRCTFTSCDVFDFLSQCKDEPKHGLYVDAPWPEVGDKYRHRFEREHHELLADRLLSFKASRVVVRFGDHPWIRELYPEHKWTWRTLKGRNQGNGETQEVLLINGESYAGGDADA